MWQCLVNASPRRSLEFEKLHICYINITLHCHKLSFAVKFEFVMGSEPIDVTVDYKTGESGRSKSEISVQLAVKSCVSAIVPLYSLSRIRFVTFLA